MRRKGAHARSRGFLVIIVLMVWALLGLLSASIGRRKGRSGRDWFFVGVLLGPIGIVVALIMPADHRSIELRRLQSGKEQKCSFCWELIKKGATCCRFCGREVPVGTPVASWPPDPEPPPDPQPDLRPDLQPGPQSAPGPDLDPGVAPAPDVPPPRKPAPDWIGMGLDAMAAGDVKEAIAAFTTAIDKGIDPARAHYCRAAAYSKAKDRRRAMEELSRSAVLGNRRAAESLRKLEGESAV